MICPLSNGTKIGPFTPISIVDDDIPEIPKETFSINLENPINASSGEPFSSEINIFDDDQQGTLIVKKIVINDNSGRQTAGEFSFQVNGGTVTPFDETEDSDDNPLTGENTLTLDTGTYSVVEPVTPDYSTSYNNCSNVVVPVGGSETCTITNNDQFIEIIYDTFLPFIFGNPCTNFFDDFSDPNSGWAVGEDEDYRYEYFGGEYRALSKNDLYGYMFGAPTCARENYTVDVDARWVGAPGESYGILFGIIGNYDQFYLFDVNTDYQDYRLLRFDGNDYHSIVPQSHSISINSGTASNQLKITRNGYQITLEVNGSILGSWTDSNIAGETYTGIISTPYLGYPTSDARFDNFSVTQVSSLEQSSMVQSNSMAPFISPREFKLAPSRKDYLIDPDLMIR